MFYGSKRNGKDDFFDYYPEIETAGRSFAFEKSGGKTCAFRAADLQFFYNEIFEEHTGEMIEADTFVRSLSSCRRDLIRWGCTNELNQQRPYCEGHERPDVVEHRKEFIEYFIDSKELYHRLDENNQVINYPIK